MKFSSLLTPDHGERGGRWFVIGDVRWLIGADGTKEHTAELVRLGRKLTRAEAKDYATRRRVENKAAAKHILLGWGPVLDEHGKEVPGTGLLDDEGRPVPYSVEAAERVLSGASLEGRELREQILEISKDSSAHAAAEEREDQAAAAAETFPRPG